MAFAEHRYTMGLTELMRRLGQDYDNRRRERSPRWQVEYVTRLIDRFDFPKPLPLMEGAALHVTVRPGSRWPMAAVLAWLDDWSPPGGDSPAEREAAGIAAHDMDEAARQLAANIIPLRQTRASQ